MMEKRLRVRCSADAGWKEGDELGVAAALVSLGGAGDDCRANCMKLEGVRESEEEELVDSSSSFNCRAARASVSICATAAAPYFFVSFRRSFASSAAYLMALLRTLRSFAGLKRV